MKIKSVKVVGNRKVYDLTVNSNNYDEQHYVLKNGVINHNTGSYYSSDNIWIIGRQQDKDGTEIQGYHFIINVEKSRYVKEKSKIPITVSYNGGINKWSGMFDLAIEAGIIVKTKPGWYSRVDTQTGEIGTNTRASDLIDNDDFWKNVLATTNFAEWIAKKYTLTQDSSIMNDNDETEENDD